MTNPIVHLDLGVTNLLEGVKFYKQVFPGWDITKADDLPDYYFIAFQDNQQLSGGIGLIDEPPEQGSIIFYVKVSDIQDTLNMITKHGGRIILQKTALSASGGYISRFEDPFGNLLGLWSES